MKFTDNELFNVGLAGLTILAGVSAPADLDRSRLEAAAARLAAIYRQTRMQQSLVTVFPNSAFAQPSFSERQRATYVDLVCDPPTAAELIPAERCYFTGLPVINRRLGVSTKSEQMKPGRVFRQHWPMLAGEGSINYGHPDGYPVSWEALLVSFALPLACAWLSGKWLAVYSADTVVIRQVAAKFVAANLDSLEAAYTAEDDKKFKGKIRPTMDNVRLGQLMITLWNETNSPLRAYHWSNSGQGPGCDMYETSPRLLRILTSIRENGLENLWWQQVMSPDSEKYQGFLYLQLLRISGRDNVGITTVNKRLGDMVKLAEQPEDYLRLQEIVLES